MPLDLKDIYCRREKEKQKFFFKKKDLYYKDEKNQEIKIYEFQDQLEDKSFCVIGIIEYLHYSVLFLNWPIPRNIIVADMKDKKVLWQVPSPKPNKNDHWLNYFIQEEEPDVIYCKAQRYIAGFKIPTGELVYEWFSNSGDPRDF